MSHFTIGREKAGDEVDEGAHALAAADGVVRDTHETAYFARSRELGFLANTLLAGCSVQSRRFTPQEASDAAAAICNLGLEYWPGGQTATPDTFPPDSLLIDHDLVTAFEVGWSVLHQEVSLFAAEQLITTLTGLTDIDCVDRDIRRGLVALRRTLVQQRGGRVIWRQSCTSQADSFASNE